MGSKIIVHSGVPGMKWGVRKSGSSGMIKPRATIARSERAAEEWALTAPTVAYSKVYRRAQFQIRKGTRNLNNNPKYAGQDFKKDSPLRREYYKDYSTMVSNQLNATVGKSAFGVGGTAVGRSPKNYLQPNKRLELNFTFDMSTDRRPVATIRQVDTSKGRAEERVKSKVVRKNPGVIKHSDEVAEELLVNLIYDDLGFIIDLEIPNTSEEVTVSHIQHSGVLGMRWGVRRSGSSGSTGSGKKQPVQLSSDAAQVRALKRKKVGELSNDELKTIQARVALEKVHTAANKSRMEAGTKRLLTLGAFMGAAVTAYNNADALMRIGSKLANKAPK